MRLLPSLLGRKALTWLSVGVVGSISLAAVELAVALFLQLFLKSLDILQADIKTIGFLERLHLTPMSFGIFLTVAAFLRATAQYLSWQSTYVAQESITARLRRIAVFDMLLRKGKRAVSAAEVSSRVGEYFIKASQASFSGANSFSYLIQASCLFLILLAAAWKEALCSLVGLVVIGVVTKVLGRRANQIASRVPEELSALTEGIVRIARNQFLIRTLRTEPDEHRRLVGNVDAYAGHAVRATHLGNLVSVTPPFVGVLLILGIVLVGRAVFHTPGLVLLSFLYLFMRFVQSLSGSVQHFSIANQYSPQLFSCLDFLAGFTPDEIDQATRAALPPVDRTASFATNVAPPEILLSTVGYRYPGSRDEVFSGISLTIPSGTQFAIVGPSGVGKSTLLSLVLGLAEPTAGAVTLDGDSPASYFARTDVRVGYVGAEAFLIEGTLRENLTYGLAGEVADDLIWAALAEAKLDVAVRAMDRGLDHPLEEDGSGLSAGQKQRLCLARALLNRPQVLILDEASANLDEATELEIASSLRALRGRCTTILVSHRAGILTYADETVRLGDG